ncbi:MAG: glycosyltransferase family 4 protein [Methanomassiliicoccales archaeon]|jgi:glycosyltransferase involved in cell wall biosynthesis
MRILVVTKYYYPVIGGVETLVRTLAERYVLAGHECTVVCMDPFKDSDEVLNGVRVVRFYRHGHARTGIHLGIWQWLMKNATLDKYDIVNVHNFHTPQALMAAYFCHSQGLPFVFTTHYHGHGQNKMRDILFRIYRVYGGNIYRWSERTICVSNFEKNLVQEDFHLLNDSIAIVPNGGRDFQNVDVLREGSILYVGRLVKYKGVDHILSAMAILKGQGKTVHLRIIGSGPEKDSLINAAHELGLDGQVDWLEGVSEEQLNVEYRKAGVLILLSALEAYGLVVAEALKSGTPCIVAKTSALTEFTSEPGCFGVEYPPDAKEVAVLIERTTAGGIKVGPLSDKLISWQQVSERYLDIYRDAIDGYWARSNKDQ